jgi:imidazolonepropionase-like amidohydrolase
MLIAGPYLESLRNIERMRRDPPESRVEPFERARIPIGSPADARRVIDSLATLELDHFKVRTVQDRETYLALAAAAHAHGKRLTGHVVTSSPAAFLEAGQDGVEHGGFTPDSLPHERRMAFWRELASRDVGVVPTLVTATESVFRPLEYYKALVSDTAPASHPLRPYLSKFMILDWREQVDELTPQRRAFFSERYWPYVLGEVREMRQAGVRIMTGSDVAVLNVFPGASLHDELRLFVDSVGMSPMEALESATREPTEWLGLADSVGTIAPGKAADLVLLDANPLDDITNTRRICAVVLRGRLFRRNDLDALLAAVAAMPDQRVNDWVR